MSDDTINFPPTPEHVNNCPTPPINTKSRIRDFIQKQLMTDVAISDNEIDGEENQRESGSPPPNCSICLGQINSKCFTDSCLHTFCFSCLLEWSKIKAECPLCKQGFKSIIHNVKSMDKYEEYKVDNYRTNWASIANQFEQFLLATSFPPFRSRVHRQRVPETYTLPNADRTSTSTNLSGSISRVYQLFLNNNVLVERFARENANDIIPNRSNGPAWRAYVYQRDLYALPLLDVNGRSRDISARFYRENPAQIHRLMGWLNREIIYLLNSAVHYNSFVLQTIEERIAQHDMTSRAFRQHIQPFFTRHTSHFLHELINFARSPYDIIGYDRNVQYRPHFYDIEIESVSIDSDRSDPSPRLSPRSDVTTEDPYMSNESQHNSQSRSVIVFGSNGEGSSRNFSTPSSYTFQPITEPVTVDTDDSDDCLFVCEQKPPHLRTPIMVELNSEEDSDVIIVETEIKEESSGTEEQPDPSTSANARHLPKPSTSRRRRNTNDSSDSLTLLQSVATDETPNDVPCVPTRRKRRQQLNDETCRGDDGPPRIKMIIRSDPQTPYSSTVTTGALLADSKSAIATVSQANIGYDGSGPSTSTSTVIRQPYSQTRNVPFKKKKYTIYDASSESSDLDSTDSSSSDSSHEELKLPKQKRLIKRASQKSLKMQNKHKKFTKNLKLKMKLKMKQMMKHLQEPHDVGSNSNYISSSCSSSSSSSSDASSSMDDDDKESSSD
ncbi:hypothetical protein HA402_000699 [Bradysia odoriphaga]|nr:hypothetical protein HA402_000699 [Bradysia odoriphaga]